MDEVSVLNGSAMADESLYRFDDQVQRSILAALLTIVCILGIPGNILVITAVLASRKLQTSTNTFVTALALTDLLSCLFIPHHIITLLLNPAPYREALLKESFICNCVGGLAFVTVALSVVTLAAIAFNRYYLITHQRVQYDKVYSTRNTIVMVCASYFYAILVSIIPSFAFDNVSYGYSEKYKLCVTHGSADQMVGLIISVLIKFPSLIVITMSYGYIFIYLKKNGIFNSSREVGSPIPAPSAERARRHATFVKVTKNMFTVMIAYLLCVIPFGVAFTFHGNEVIIPWVCLLVLMNGCVNPMLYGLSHPHFKQVFPKIVTGRMRDIPEPSKLLKRLLKLV